MATTRMTDLQGTAHDDCAFACRQLQIESVQCIEVNGLGVESACTFLVRMSNANAKVSKDGRARDVEVESSAEYLSCMVAHRLIDVLQLSDHLLTTFDLLLSPARGGPQPLLKHACMRSSNILHSLVLDADRFTRKRKMFYAWNKRLIRVQHKLANDEKYRQLQFSRMALIDEFFQRALDAGGELIACSRTMQNFFLQDEDGAGATTAAKEEKPTIGRASQKRNESGEKGDGNEKKPELRKRKSGTIFSRVRQRSEPSLPTKETGTIEAATLHAFPTLAQSMTSGTENEKCSIDLVHPAPSSFSAKKRSASCAARVMSTTKELKRDGRTVQDVMAMAKNCTVFDQVEIPSRKSSQTEGKTSTKETKPRWRMLMVEQGHDECISVDSYSSSLMDGYRIVNGEVISHDGFSPSQKGCGDPILLRQIEHWATAL